MTDGRDSGRRARRRPTGTLSVLLGSKPEASIIPCLRHLGAGALFRGLRGAGEIIRGVDQRNMRKGLRKIADKTFRHGIIFLG